MFYKFFFIPLKMKKEDFLWIFLVVFLVGAFLSLVLYKALFFEGGLIIISVAAGFFILIGGIVLAVSKFFPKSGFAKGVTSFLRRVLRGLAELLLA